MVRKQIYLEARQDVQLKRLARRLGVSEAALIRQSVDRGLRSALMPHRDLDAWEEIKVFIRKRMQHVPSVARETPSRRWRREDLYDLGSSLIRTCWCIPSARDSRWRNSSNAGAAEGFVVAHRSRVILASLSR